MAKQSGLGDRLFIGGYDLSGDIGSIEEIGGGHGVTDMTDITQSAVARAALARDGRMSFTAFHNPAANRAHDRLSLLPTTDQIATYLRGTAIGGPAASLVAKQINFDPTRNQDGSLTNKIDMVANGYGLEWGTQLTAGLRADTGATNGTAVDFTASSAFGLQAYLQVTAFTGTDATITIQESSDNAGDAYAAVVGGAFTQVTSGPTTQRIATSGSLAVERYLRVATTTTGGFTALSFIVMVNRNTVTPT